MITEKGLFLALVFQSFSPIDAIALEAIARPHTVVESGPVDCSSYSQDDRGADQAMPAVT